MSENRILNKTDHKTDHKIDNKIIVGYDGSASAAEAVDWAAGEADLRSLPLRIVSCFEMPMLAAETALGWGASQAFEAAREAAIGNISAIEATVRATHPMVDVTTDVSPGPAGQALLDGATAGDLVVVGSSSHSGAASFWLGSTPRYLVSHSHVPVAVVRGAASRGVPDRIVVGIDGSETSDTAMRWAMDEADRHQVELVVVHAWSYPYAPVDTGAGQARDLTQVDAACTLERAAEAARDRLGVAVSDVLVEGAPIDALLATVRDGDVLVVGSRGRGALRSRLFGSTVNSVLDACVVPVVVVGPNTVVETDTAPARVTSRS